MIDFAVSVLIAVMGGVICLSESISIVPQIQKGTSIFSVQFLIIQFPELL